MKSQNIFFKIIYAFFFLIISSVQVFANQDCNLTIAKNYLEAGYTDRAQSCLASLNEKEAKKYESRMFYAKFCLDSGKYSCAITQFKHAIRQEPKEWRNIIPILEKEAKLLVVNREPKRAIYLVKSAILLKLEATGNNDIHLKQNICQEILEYGNNSSNFYSLIYFDEYVHSCGNDQNQHIATKYQDIAEPLPILKRKPLLVKAAALVGWDEVHKRFPDCITVTLEPLVGQGETDEDVIKLFYFGNNEEQVAIGDKMVIESAQGAKYYVWEYCDEENKACWKQYSGKAILNNSTGTKGYLAAYAEEGVELTRSIVKKVTTY